MRQIDRLGFQKREPIRDEGEPETKCTPIIIGRAQDDSRCSPVYSDAARATARHADATIGLPLEPLEGPLVVAEERRKPLITKPVVILQDRSQRDPR